MEDIKKNRGVNFKSDEKTVLVNLISKNKDIVENKKTDGVSLREKELSWEAITEEFNSHINVTKRTTKQLKSFYDNSKRRAKKKNTEDKINLFKTGGGSQVTTLDDTEAQLLSVIKEQITPLQNNFDSDHSYMRTGWTSNNCVDFGMPLDFNVEVIPISLEACSRPAEVVKENPVPAIEAEATTVDENIVTPQTTPVKFITSSEKLGKWRMRNRPALKNIKKSEAAIARQKISELAQLRKNVIELEVDQMQEKHKATMEVLELKKEALRLKIKYYNEKIKENN